MALRIAIIQDDAGLADLREPWLELLARSDTNEPMLSPLWIEPWWNVFGGALRQLTVVTFHEGSELVGLAPMCRRTVSVAPFLSLRRLEALGTGEHEHDEVCSEYLGLIAATGQMPAVADAFVSALAGGRLGGVCDEIYLPALAGDGVCLPELTRALRRHRWKTDLKATPAAPYIPLPDSFDAYLAALPQKNRYGIRRAVRDFDEWADGRASLHEANDEASLVEGMRILGALHGERWQAAGRSGAFASDNFARFLGDAARRLLERGALELIWLSVDGEPIAVAFNMVWNRKIYFYQTGRKMDLPAKIRPGVVLHARTIERAIAAGLREYDFLAGTTRYKLDLALATRPLYTLRGTRPGWPVAARHAVERARRAVRSLRQRLLDRRGGDDPDGVHDDPDASA